MSAQRDGMTLDGTSAPVVGGLRSVATRPPGAPGRGAESEVTR